jgi:hypothetical protein
VKWLSVNICAAQLKECSMASQGQRLFPSFIKRWLYLHYYTDRDVGVQLNNKDALRQLKWGSEVLSPTTEINQAIWEELKVPGILSKIAITKRICSIIQREWRKDLLENLSAHTKRLLPCERWKDILLMQSLQMEQLNFGALIELISNQTEKCST